MAKQLVVLCGLERGRTIPLADTDIVQIGCSQHLPIEHRFRDPLIARVHCEIQVREGRATVFDAGTTGGTFLNGRRITQEELKQSDVIRIGSTQLRFLCTEAAEATRPDLPALPATFPPSGAKDRTAGDEILMRLVGRTIAHFNVELVLGNGQWGRVFRARDTRRNRTVALKVLRPEFAAGLKRLEHFGEALKVVAPLRHPSVVTHYGAGTAGPLSWIAMELVDGHSLTRVIRRIATTGLLDWRYASRVAAQLAGALARVHEHGVIHGHLTPQNVLVRERDLNPLLGDLLLANTLVRSKIPVGQLPVDCREHEPWLAPEQVAGSAEVDPRSDIYSLGAVVYALLTGRPPYFPEACDDTVEEMRQRELIAPGKYQPTLAPQFDDVVQKMLSRRPVNRFQSAAELLASLERITNRSRTSA
jgi:serine/threonine protein kinase